MVDLHADTAARKINAMGSLLKLLVLVVLVGVAVQQRWFDTLLGLSKEVAASPEAETVGWAAMSGLSAAIDALRNLPEPWSTIAILIGGFAAVAAVLSIAASIVYAVVRLVGWLRDILV
jgi:hypothetical protein